MARQQGTRRLLSMFECKEDKFKKAIPSVERLIQKNIKGSHETQPGLRATSEE